MMLAFTRHVTVSSHVMPRHTASHHTTWSNAPSKDPLRRFVQRRPPFGMLDLRIGMLDLRIACRKRVCACACGVLLCQWRLQISPIEHSLSCVIYCSPSGHHQQRNSNIDVTSHDLR
jgi:hypothetical protein